MKSSKSSTPCRHGLLARSRQWHLWGGITASVFILTVAGSGIILNYRKPVFAALGLEETRQVRSEKNAALQTTTPRFTSGRGFANIPVSVESALQIARDEWGDVALERIELKDERGELTYKVKRKSGDELWVNAATGTFFMKGEYEKAKPTGAGTVARSTDWGKIILDLHTGRIGGEIGKAVMSVAALLLLFLTGSGIYMWVKPILIRRQNAKMKNASVARIVLGELTESQAVRGG